MRVTLSSSGLIAIAESRVGWGLADIGPPTCPDRAENASSRERTAALALGGEDRQYDVRGIRPRQSGCALLARQWPKGSATSTRRRYAKACQSNRPCGDA